MDLDYVQQHWCNHMNSDVSASIKAWDSVAEDYTYEDSDKLANDPFLKTLQKTILLDKQMSVLDVGCGAGAYGVALSPKVGNVVGTDFSPKMLGVGRKYAAKKKISNIEFVERDWWSCDGGEFRGKYDLVFAHTTPAIADYASFVKLMESSRRYCALCKPARRTDEVTDAIRALAGVSLKGNDDSVAYAFDTIWATGCNPTVSYDKTVWHSEKALENAKIWYLSRLKGSCQVDEKTEQTVCGYLESIAHDGVVQETIRTTLVTMIWSV